MMKNIVSANGVNYSNIQIIDMEQEMLKYLLTDETYDIASHLWHWEETCIFSIYILCLINYKMKYKKPKTKT